MRPRYIISSGQAKLVVVVCVCEGGGGGGWGGRGCRLNITQGYKCLFGPALLPYLDVYFYLKVFGLT